MLTFHCNNWALLYASVRKGQERSAWNGNGIKHQQNAGWIWPITDMILICSWVRAPKCSFLCTDLTTAMIFDTLEIISLCVSQDGRRLEGQGWGRWWRQNEEVRSLLFFFKSQMYFPARQWLSQPFGGVEFQQWGCKQHKYRVFISLWASLSHTHSHAHAESVILSLPPQWQFNNSSCLFGLWLALQSHLHSVFQLLLWKHTDHFLSQNHPPTGLLPWLSVFFRCYIL